MNPTALIKPVVDLVVSAGVGTIVGNAIKASTPADVKVYQKITIGVGSFVLSSLVGSKAASYANDQITEAGQQLKKAKDAFPKKQD